MKSEREKAIPSKDGRLFCRHVWEIEAKAVESGKKMETSEGMREVLSESHYGRGTCKHRSSERVVVFKISDPKVQVSETHGILPVGQREVKAFQFEMPDPDGHGMIHLGVFCRSTLGESPNLLHAGDRYISDSGLSGYLQDMRDAFKQVASDGLLDPAAPLKRRIVVNDA
jgi:hypothetical protein